MLREKTVFVLGAGASVDYGFPLGNKLRDDLVELINVNIRDVINKIIGKTRVPSPKEKFWLAVMENVLNVSQSEFEQLTQRIVENLPSAKSVDEFISRDMNDEKSRIILKLAVVYLILESERNSALYYDINRGDTNFDKRHKSWFSADKNSLRGAPPGTTSWYDTLWSAIVAEVEQENAESLFNDIAFITFNYDRSLEQFLYHRVTQFLRGDESRAKNIMKGLSSNIFHMYGQVGYLGYELRTDSGVMWPYGQHFGECMNNLVETNTSCANLQMMEKQIKTISEKEYDGLYLDRLHDIISEAGQLYFIGMAYHHQNMNLILPSIKKLNARYVKGTGTKVPESMRKAISTEMAKWLPNLRPEIKTDELVVDQTADQFIHSIGYPLIKYVISPIH